MVIIKQFKFNDKKLAQLATDIRKQVFVSEQKVPAELEYDGKDEEATHYLMYYTQTPIATARWRYTEKGVKLERFALLKDYRNQRLGKYLLEAVMKDVIQVNKPIYLHAQERAMNFYKRYGFVSIGEAFEEAGINHFEMIWEKK